MTKLADLKKAGGIPAKALGDAAAAVAPSTTALAQLGLVRGAEATLPVIGPVWIQLLGHGQDNQVEGGVIAAMAEHKIPLGDLWVWTVDLERKARTLALAVREPGDHSKPFGTLEEWIDLDDRVIFACSLKYDEIRDRLDPLAAAYTITPERAEALLDAFKKKDRNRLLCFGIDELASWLLSGAVQPSTCPTPSSGSTEPSPAISP